MTDDAASPHRRSDIATRGVPAIGVDDAAGLGELEMVAHHPSDHSIDVIARHHDSASMISSREHTARLIAIARYQKCPFDRGFLHQFRKVQASVLERIQSGI